MTLSINPHIIYMSGLAKRLQQLGLSQYLDVFVAEGFDTWDTVLDITESDLDSLSVKLGHRRKLQRAIAESRGQSADRPLPIALGTATSVELSYLADDSASESRERPAESATGGAPGTSTKRKYRRHPKPDEHAPERPPSAYVIFSNQVRETLRGQDLSFTEIAKAVGERWQVLAADAREQCERQANTAKERYYAQLAEYKKTQEYRDYQRYLEEFKAKHAAPQKGTEGKRSKTAETPSAHTRSSHYEQADHSSRRTSLLQADPFALGRYRSGSSPPVAPARLPSAPLYPSKSTSPATHPLSAMNSPRLGEQYSPMSASPRLPSLHKESSSDSQQNPSSGDPRVQPDSNLPLALSAYGQAYQPPSIASPSTGYTSYYRNTPIDLPSRRSFREPTQLPSLTHEDTTLSSLSSNASYPGPSFVPPVDSQKSMRTLPQPVPSLGPAPSPLDRPLSSFSPAQQQPDFRSSSSLAVLLRVGEDILTRATEDEDMEEGDSR